MTSPNLHPDVGLPILDDGRPLSYGGQGMDNLQLPARELTMIRRVAFDYDSRILLRMPLSQLLDISDNVLTDYASHLGAAIPYHTWGLYPRKACEGRIYEYPERGIPDDYILAADVEVVEDATALSYDDKNTTELSLTLRSIKLARQKLNKPTWSDANPRQFVTGDGRMSGHHGLWLIDIEPSLSNL